MLIDKEGAKRVLQSIMTIMEDIFRGTMKRFIGSEKTTRLVTNKDEKGFSYIFTPPVFPRQFFQAPAVDQKNYAGERQEAGIASYCI